MRNAPECTPFCGYCQQPSTASLWAFDGQLSETGDSMTKGTHIHYVGVAAFAGTLLGSVAAPTSAEAQLAPPGYILDVGALSGYGLAPYAYTYYSTTFTATLSETTVSFAFRNDPAYFSFDDVSVALTGGGPNLLVDPGFEAGTKGSNSPPGWTYFIQPSTITGPLGATGSVESGTPTGDADNPHSGPNYWFDGSVGGYDGIGQRVATTIGQSYTIGFYLADDNTRQTGSEANFDAGNDPGVSKDVFVYAQSTIPAVPELSTWAMALIGFASLGVARRRRTAP